MSDFVERQHAGCANSCRYYTFDYLQSVDIQGKFLIVRSDCQTDSGWPAEVSWLQYADDAGYWGTWRAWAKCPAGHFVIGFQQRNEENQGSADDSTLNAVRMLCSDQSTISSYDGVWGSWSQLVQCGSGSSFDAYRIRIEGDQGSSDDTAAGAVEMYCGNEMVSATGMAWGDWRPKRECGQGYKICGFRIRFEGVEGISDQTAMNGIEVQCCGDQETSATLTDCICTGNLHICIMRIT